MSYTESKQRMQALRERVTELRQQIRAIQQSIEPETVQDYALHGSDGRSVRLGELFADKDTLILIHNMGAGCVYCTLWADGFNGVYDHLRDRAAFVVSSPDAPEKQQKFAQSRGWRFPMISHAGTSFAADLGYAPGGRFQPGVSVFKRRGTQIVRVSDTQLGPGDDFCSVWHLFDLIPEGPAGWQPKYKYA